jgi:hypothetical protein
MPSWAAARSSSMSAATQLTVSLTLLYAILYTKEDYSMATAMLRVSAATRDILRELAAQSGEPMQAVLEKAVEQYRRQRMFDEADAAYAALRRDSEAWQEELEERRLWEATLPDGQDTGEVWNEDGTVSDRG